MITVFIVDDKPDLLKNLSTYIGYAEDLKVVGTALSGVQALGKLKSIQADVVLSDINMPNMDGIELLSHLRNLENPPKFVAITALDTDDNMLETLAGGGAGYITKDQSPESIIQAIRDACDGGTSISPESMSRLLTYIPLTSQEVVCPSGSSKPLTDVERKVLRRLCKGMSNREIAQDLNYAESSVKRHVSSLMNHFNTTSRLKLALLALRSHGR